MKAIPKKSKDTQGLRDEILQSLIASFRIEGIDISLSVAKETLKKVEISLGK
ncbi:MAG: hypothetical protein IPP46_03100 [Bacteroidetes bacterium]|nr:hypothetical protein [Bacteroidota bacterium]